MARETLQRLVHQSQQAMEAAPLPARRALAAALGACRRGPEQQGGLSSKRHQALGPGSVFRLLRHLPKVLAFGSVVPSQGVLKPLRVHGYGPCACSGNFIGWHFGITSSMKRLVPQPDRGGINDTKAHCPLRPSIYWSPWSDWTMQALRHTPLRLEIEANYVSMPTPQIAARSIPTVFWTALRKQSVWEW